MQIKNSLQMFLLRIVMLFMSPFSANAGLTWNLNMEGIQIEQTRLTNMAGKGGFGGILRSAPMQAIELFIGYGIIIVVVFVLAGTSTGSAGVFGNVTAANAFRDSGVIIAKFGSIVGLLVTLKLIGSLL